MFFRLLIFVFCFVVGDFDIVNEKKDHHFDRTIFFATCLAGKLHCLPCAGSHSRSTPKYAKALEERSLGEGFIYYRYARQGDSGRGTSTFVFDQAQGLNKCYHFRPTGSCSIHPQAFNFRPIQSNSKHGSASVGDVVRGISAINDISVGIQDTRTYPVLTTVYSYTTGNQYVLKEDLAGQDTSYLGRHKTKIKARQKNVKLNEANKILSARNYKDITGIAPIDAAEKFKPIDAAPSSQADHDFSLNLTEAAKDFHCEGQAVKIISRDIVQHWECELRCNGNISLFNDEISKLQISHNGLANEFYFKLKKKVCLYGGASEGGVVKLYFKKDRGVGILLSLLRENGDFLSPAVSSESDQLNFFISAPINENYVKCFFIEIIVSSCLDQANITVIDISLSSSTKAAIMPDSLYFQNRWPWQARLLACNSRNFSPVSFSKKCQPYKTDNFYVLEKDTFERYSLRDVGLRFKWNGWFEMQQTHLCKEHFDPEGSVLVYDESASASMDEE